ncbi:hypothetical protein RRG08_065400, partial [Elysia crispata]
MQVARIVDKFRDDHKKKNPKLLKEKVKHYLKSGTLDKSLPSLEGKSVCIVCILEGQRSQQGNQSAVIHA